MTKAETSEILSRITTRNEAGTHFTQLYSDDDLSQLQADGLIKITRPIHDATGIPYSQEHWSVDVTAQGLEWLDANLDDDDSAMICFHGSSSQIGEITDTGLFGGVFAGTDDVALSHGRILHRILSPRPLTNYELNYEIENAWETALRVARGDEAVAECIMTPECGVERNSDGEQAWEMQRLRGKLAAQLGYTSIEMRDEHGTTWLCLPGCKITLAL